MSPKFVDVQNEYAKDKDLKSQDVKVLMEWAHCQPHLPKINELQAILFLQSCYYSNEQAKKTIDTYFTVKTICSDIFLDRNPTKSPLKDALDVSMFAILPKTTPEGYSIFYMKMRDPNPDVYNFNLALKYFDMTAMSWLYQDQGTAVGHIILIDMKDVLFGHMTKFSPLTMKKFLYYLQEAMPVRLKGMHYINVVPFMDKLLSLMKPFMKKELLNMLHLHTDLESATKFIPRECMPSDYGGSIGTLEEIHSIWKKKVLNSIELFEWEEKQLVDESKRPGKPKNAGDFFGVEGTFKKLELD